MKTSEGLEFWAQVEKSEAKYVKAIPNKSYSAIDAHSQLRRATELWGPLGGAWWIEVEDSILTTTEGPLFFVRLKLFTPLGSHPIIAYASTPLTPTYKRGQPDEYTTLDDEAPKKTVTNARSKALSELGFNADVFFGKFKDDKSLAAARREGHQSAPPAGHTSPPCTAKQRGMIFKLAGEIHGINNTHIPDMLDERGIASFEAVTMSQASTWISNLIEEKKSLPPTQTFDFEEVAE